VMMLGCIAAAMIGATIGFFLCALMMMARD
jgi:hypothetical protein